MEDLRKPLAILTNKPTFAEELSMKCEGDVNTDQSKGWAQLPGKEEKSDSKCELSHLHRKVNPTVAAALRRIHQNLEHPPQAH